MSNSSLASYTKLSPNHSGARNHKIDTISIHCMAGNLSIESCGELFARSSTGASSNYGIGSDGRIALYVDEANRSWCTSSASNDHRAITIEVANTVAATPYPVSDQAYAALINLLVDVCYRNGIERLLWKGDKSLIGQIDKQNMTVHRWFAAKDCPGEWLYSRHGQIAEEVNKRLASNREEEEEMSYEQFAEYMSRYNAELARQAPSTWAAENARNAILSGLFSDGDGDGTLDNPQAPVKRQELAAVLDRAGILAAADKFIRRYDELPAWAQPTIRGLLDNGTINGGTADDPDDINMYLSDIKVICVVKRMIDAGK